MKVKQKINAPDFVIRDFIPLSIKTAAENSLAGLFSVPHSVRILRGVNANVSEAEERSFLKQIVRK